LCFLQEITGFGKSPLAAVWWRANFARFREVVMVNYDGRKRTHVETNTG
jgi:hypothetical protein